MIATRADVRVLGNRPTSRPSDDDRGAAVAALSTVGPLDRTIAAALIALVALSTLEWITITGFGGGFVKPFHVGAIAIGAVGLARLHPERLVFPMVRRHTKIYVAYLLSLAITFLASQAHATPYASGTSILRNTTYACASIVVAGLLVQVVGSPRVRRLLAWAGAWTVGVLTAGMLAAFASQGVNPVSVIREALAKGDPDIVSYQLLRTAFRTDVNLADVGANLRHKVFLAILVGVFLGLACLPAISRRNRRARVIILGSSAFGLGLVLLSLSRSAIVCLAVAPILISIRLLLRRRARSSHVFIVGLGFAVLAALAVSPVADLLVSRFSSTNSYDARIQGTVSDEFLKELRNGTVVGIDQPEAPLGTHNLVLDAWLGGGIAAGVCAFVLCLALGVLWWRAVRSYLSNGAGWVLPVNQLWVIAIGAIPLVRSVTAGNQFHLVEWTAIGLFLAMITANARAGELQPT